MLRLRVPIPRLVSAGEIYGGTGSLVALRALGSARAAVVVSRSTVARDDYMAALKRAVGALDVRPTSIPSGEPTVAVVEALAGEFRDYRPDWIVAVGGGSVLDAARGAWIRYEHQESQLSSFARPFSLPPLRGLSRFAAVPVTFGTGAEVSSAIVISDDESGTKRVVVSHDLLPDVVVLDPALTANVPEQALGASMLDALAHVLEGAVSRVSNPLVDVFGSHALAMLLSESSDGVPAPTDLNRRFLLQVAAMQGGWVQNHRPPGLAHAMAHQLGSFGLAHGVAVGLCLPAAMKINARTASVAAAYDKVARTVGLSCWQDLVSAVEKFRERLGFSPSLRATSAKAADGVANDRADFISRTCSDLTARTNPVPVESGTASELLEAIA